MEDLRTNLWKSFKIDLKGTLWRMLVEGPFLLRYKRTRGCFQRDEEHGFFEWGEFFNNNDIVSFSRMGFHGLN